MLAFLQSSNPLRPAALVLWAGAAVAAPPERVVSMNLCTDQLAMMLAAPGQLVSVSHLASEVQSSSMVEEARAYPMNRGQVEQVFLMRPDLVRSLTLVEPVIFAAARGHVRHKAGPKEPALRKARIAAIASAKSDLAVESQ